MASNTDFLLALEGGHRLVRRLQSRQRPQSLHRLWRAARDHRAERRRQDHRARSDLRPYQGFGRLDQVQGPGDHRAARSRRSSAAASAASSRPRSIYEDLTVFENLELSLPRGRDVAGALFWKRTGDVIERVREIAAMIYLDGQLDRPAETLSHGQKQWLEIGMLLIQDPELLMLDEPVAGMSVSERKKTAELLNAIIKNRSVIVIEHDMKFVESIAHRVTVLHQGKVLAEGDMAVGPEQSEGQGSLSRTLRTSRMFEVHNLSAGLRPKRGAACDRYVGERLARSSPLVGRNGMGKSTLMKSLIGVMPSALRAGHGRRRRCQRACRATSASPTGSPMSRKGGRFSAP